MTEFVPFPKIKRLFKDNCVLTEKIDGTNASVTITEDGQMLAGSRTRWITPGKGTDNYGFAGWVHDNQDELYKLGPGTHYGEWWGRGIQRNYGLKEKRFSLFNTGRWSDDLVRPKCCHVVPVLKFHTFDTKVILDTLEELRMTGSVAAPGFMDVEGIVVYHIATQQLFKYTVDDNYKGEKDVTPQEI